MKGRFPKPPSVKGARINDRIRVPQIRLVGPDGSQMGVMIPSKALEIAKQHNLDLVEVAPTARPPVCRVMDYSKYKYEQAKKGKEAKKHQKSTHLKEIRVRPRIEDNDYQTKMRNIQRFLSRGDHVRISLRFRGREMAHQEFGRQLLDRLTKDLAEVAQVERTPLQEGRVISMTFSPK